MEGMVVIEKDAATKEKNTGCRDPMLATLATLSRKHGLMGGQPDDGEGEVTMPLRPKLPMYPAQASTSAPNTGNTTGKISPDRCGLVGYRFIFKIVF